MVEMEGRDDTASILRGSALSLARAPERPPEIRRAPNSNRRRALGRALAGQRSCRSIPLSPVGRAWRFLPFSTQSRLRGGGAEGETEQAEQFKPFLVRAARGDEGHVHSLNELHVVHVDFGKDGLFGDA